MADPTFDLNDAHRWFGVTLNNRTWDMLESAGRTPVDAELMVHMAYATCFHWLQVGTPAHHQRAQCLIANVHAALGHGPAALRHAERCLALLAEHADLMADWDHAFAHDCAARANAASERTDDAKRLRRTARELGDRIADHEERRMFDDWHAGGEWHGLDA